MLILASSDWCPMPLYDLVGQEEQDVGKDYTLREFTLPSESGCAQTSSPHNP